MYFVFLIVNKLNIKIKPYHYLNLEIQGNLHENNSFLIDREIFMYRLHIKIK